MGTKRTPDNFKNASAKVAEILKLITSGPRFRGHLDRIANENRLNSGQHKDLLRKSMRNFLGYN